MTENKYGSDSRSGINFGERRLLPETDTNFINLPLEDQVKHLAWSEGCPVMNKVIDRAGLKVARDRYGEVIFASRIVLSQAELHNPELSIQLKQGLKRKDREPVGEHEPTSVPMSHLTEISTPNTPWGYSLPRILVEQFGNKSERNQGRMQKGIQILERSIKKADSPLSLIAIFSNNVVKAFPSIIDSVLKRTFSSGYLKEENTFELYGELLTEIKKHSPMLYKRYTELSSEEKADKGIAEL